MPPGAPAAPRASRSEHVLLVVTVVAVVAALGALTAWVWYPTTLQPNLVLTNTPFVATRCAPVSSGGYANTFNTTLTLVNGGRADGDASVQFLIGNFSLGYKFYTVRVGAPVTDRVSILWEVYATPTECGPLDVPGPPAVSLASVARSPPIDSRALVYATVQPAATLGFAGGMLGALGLLARRRGISLLRDVRGEGWGIAFLMTFAASWFASLLTQALMVQYNTPADWTPLLVYVAVVVVGVTGATVVSWRAILRAARHNGPPRT